MVRSFIALNLPDEIRAGVEEIQGQVILPGVKAVERSCLHVTMYFLGEVKQEKIDRVIGELDRVEDAPQPLSIKGVGAFPKPGNPRVIWVGAHGEIKPLHSGIENALGNEGFTPDSRFHPHVTMGRVKNIEPAGRIELAERIEDLKDYRVGDFTVESFELMKSTLTPEGPIYEIIKSFKL